MSRVGIVYFTKFTKKTGQIFYKFGHSANPDASVRMEWIIKPFPGKFKYKILSVIKTDDIEKCKKMEIILQKRYPKNFYLYEKISGVTECAELTEKEEQHIIDGMEEWKNRYDRQENK